MKSKIIIGIIIATLAYSCNRKSMYSTEIHQQIHFSLAGKWVGEPSGLLYHEGKYHLFYQANPANNTTTGTGWGHAVSSDLLHWELLPLALLPDSCGNILPGSVITDLHNTSGLGSDASPPFIAFYTYGNPNNKDSKDSVRMTYSLDNGRSWIKYNDHVLEGKTHTGFCNPKVSWNNITKQWLMTVSTGTSIQIYSSPDCLKWSYLSDFGDDLGIGDRWEAPDLFPLKVKGSEAVKWVMMVTTKGDTAEGNPAIHYFVGEFNGVEFKMTQRQELWVDYGKDNCSGMTFDNASDSRKIMLGWMYHWRDAACPSANKWQGGMFFPRELELVPESSYYLLTSIPVKELKKIYGKTDSIGAIKLSGEKQIFGHDSFPKTPFILKMLFDNSTRHAIWNARDYGVRLKTRTGKYISVGYNSELNYYYVDASDHTEILPSGKSGATYTFNNPVSDWYMLVDGGSVELFACGNRIAITTLCFPDEPFESFELYAESGSATLIEASLIELKI